MANLAVINDPLYSLASMIRDPNDSPLMMRFLMGNFLCQLPVFAWIYDVNAAPEDRDCGAAAFNAASMSGRIDAAGKAAYNRNPPEAQIGCEPLRHLQTVNGRLPGSDNRNAGLFQCLQASLRI